MRARLSWTLVAAVVLVACSASAPAQGKAGAIDTLLTRYHEVGAFNGAALVAAGGTVILEKGYGFADFEWKIPNTPDTKFRLGSITKQFTATLVLQLVEHGQLSLEKRARAYERRLAGVANAEYLDMSLPYAAGSLYSTVEDLSIYAKALELDPTNRNAVEKLNELVKR